MVIKDQKVRIKIGNRNKTYYKNLGYDVSPSFIYVDIKHITPSSKAEVVYICDTCNKEFKREYYRLKKKNTYCPDCNPGRHKTKKQYEQELLNKFNIVIKVDKYVNNLTKVKHTNMQTGQTFFSAPSVVLNSGNKLVHEYSKENQYGGRPKDSTDIKLSRYINKLFKKYQVPIIVSTYIDELTPIKHINLRNGYIFTYAPSTVLRGAVNLEKPITSSNKAKIWLNKLGIKDTEVPIGPYRADGQKGNNIYEFYGDYWHGNPDKYNYNKVHIQANSTFGELLEKTVKKEEYLINKGYTLYTIWENDYIPRYPMYIPINGGECFSVSKDMELSI